MDIKKLMMIARYVCIFAMFTAIGSHAATANENNAAPRENLYLQEIIATYGSYSSYQDKGEIEVVYYEGGKKVDKKLKEFSTLFTRDGLFEIKWKKVLKKGGEINYTIWKSEDDVYSKYGGDAKFRSASLTDALSRAAGISTLLTTYVPCLLFEETMCFLCDKGMGYVVTATVQEEENLLRLDLEDSSKNKERIWIDNKRNILKKIEWWNERGDLRIHHRITYSDIQVSE